MRSKICIKGRLNISIKFVTIWVVTRGGGGSRQTVTNGDKGGGGSRQKVTNGDKKGRGGQKLGFLR